MNVLQLIDEVAQRVPDAAPWGTRWTAQAQIARSQGGHRVAVAARIDARGRRHEHYHCDGARVERHVLLRLTCAETECPQARAVRAQWAAFHQRRPARTPEATMQPRPLIEEQAVVVGRHHCTARPATFNCFTPCPNGAHPAMTMEKTGYDLFEDGVYLGGGLVEQGGVSRPRLPGLRAAEAFVLARHLEAIAALGHAAGPDLRDS